MKSVALLSLASAVLGAPTIGNTLTLGNSANGNTPPLEIGNQPVLRAPAIGDPPAVRTPRFGSSVLGTPAVDAEYCEVDVMAFGPKTMFSREPERWYHCYMRAEATFKRFASVFAPVPAYFKYSASKECGECEIRAFGYTFTVTGGQSITKDLRSLNIQDRQADIKRTTWAKCHAKVGQAAHPMKLPL